MDLCLCREYNDGGCLLWAENLPGAFTRGKTAAEAEAKLETACRSYCRWVGLPFDGIGKLTVTAEKQSPLQICDADSDLLFPSERLPLSPAEYRALRALVLRSAADFQCLYDSVKEKDQTTLLPRQTFYGAVPRTAREMYEHTKNVNSYYFGEIGVSAGNTPDILSCRRKGFAALEALPDFLATPPRVGSYGEEWSLRKVCRRFLWHDRIHARAMYRMACRLPAGSCVTDPFCFA